MKKAYLILNTIRWIPHILLFYLSKNKAVIIKDIRSWLKILKKKHTDCMGLLYLLTFFPEFRNLFYHRIGAYRHFLKILCPGLSTLYISTPRIGEGLFIQHGFSTIISAKFIGANCWINQQVTIGYSNEYHRPTLMDNVTVYAGAKIIGNVTIGENSIIGANSVVVKNVPPNCTVVGVPAMIVKINGVKCKKSL